MLTTVIGNIDKGGFELHQRIQVFIQGFDPLPLRGAALQKEIRVSLAWLIWSVTFISLQNECKHTKGGRYNQTISTGPFLCRLLNLQSLKNWPAWRIFIGLIELVSVRRFDIGIHKFTGSDGEQPFSAVYW